MISLYIFLCTENQRNRLVDKLLTEKQHVLALRSLGTCTTCDKVDRSTEDLKCILRYDSGNFHQALRLLSMMTSRVIHIKVLTRLCGVTDSCGKVTCLSLKVDLSAGIQLSCT